jgi:hypothetical protein
MRAADLGLSQTKFGKTVQDLDRQNANSANKLLARLPVFNEPISRGIKFDDAKSRDEFLKSIADGFEVEAMSSFSSDSNTASRYAGKAGVILSIRK